MAETCGIPFRVRRGTKAQLVSYGPLASGELGWTTDEAMLYAGDGTQNYLVGRALYSVGAPAGNGVSGQLYVDTSSSGIYLSNGSGWFPVGSSHLQDLAGTLDDIQDGVTYEKVKATEVENGYIVRLYDGSYIVTASGAYSHINNGDLHRVINDLGISNIELWSSQKINDTVSAAIHGLDPQNSVLDRDLCTPPLSPSENDRYIICGTVASGSWATYENNISEYIGGVWEFTAPNKGFLTYVEDESRLYIYTDSGWSPLSDIVVHNNLSGLQGGASNNYYHLSSSQYIALTSDLTETVADIMSATISGGAGININYDDSSGIISISLGSHSLTSSSYHSVSTVSGYVLKAIGTNEVDMAPITLEMLPTIDHSDLSGVSPDQHHPRLHTVINASLDHDWGVLVDNTLLGVVTSSSGVVWVTELSGGTF